MNNVLSCLVKICFIWLPSNKYIISSAVHLSQWTLCMKDRKYDKRHVWNKNHSGCLETSYHVHGPLRNKMAMLGVIPSRSDIDPSTDPVPDQTMLPTVSVSLTESDIPGAFLKAIHLKRLRVCQTLSSLLLAP